MPAFSHGSYNAAMSAMTEPDSVSTRVQTSIEQAIDASGGWLPFDRFMSMALYEPGAGYYARADRQFGAFPESGSDFITAPELSPLFGRCIAAQVRQALQASQTDTVVEFGAGSGVLAADLIETLGDRLRHYWIVDLSGALRRRQAERLARFGARVRWLSAWPDALEAVVLGNEVLDAMPVKLLAWDGRCWFERGVTRRGDALGWRDVPTALRPPIECAFVPGTVTEIHPQAEAFIGSLAQRLHRGAAFFFDYGFPAAEYYHPQRLGGTLMCHRAHRSDMDPLLEPGSKDITAHVNFSGIALAAQHAGLDVIGYTSQGRFLINCGLPALMQAAGTRQRAAAQMLVAEHEMGELFKAIGFAAGCRFDPVGFAAGDRTHRL
jgi:SAM-dependent MidA family methyltransferase